MGVTYQVAHILLWFGNIELHLVFDKELKTQVVLCRIKMMSLWDEGKMEEDWLFDTINLTAPHQWLIFVQIEIGINKAIQLFYPATLGLVIDTIFSQASDSASQICSLVKTFYDDKILWWLLSVQKIINQVSFHLTSQELNMNHGSGLSLLPCISFPERTVPTPLALWW